MAQQNGHHLSFPKPVDDAAEWEAQARTFEHEIGSFPFVFSCSAHFMEWLPTANRKYDSLLEQEQASRRERERRKLEAERKELELQAELRRTIKL